MLGQDLVSMSVDTQPIPQMLCNCELSAAFQFTVGGLSADCQYCVLFCIVFAEMSNVSILIRHCGAACNTTILACRVKEFKQNSLVHLLFSVAWLMPLKVP